MNVKQHICKILESRDVYPHHFNSDTDPSFHFYTKLCPTFHFNADPDPDPASDQASDPNPQSYRFLIGNKLLVFTTKK